MLTKEILCAYAPFGVKVQTEDGILNLNGVYTKEYGINVFLCLESSSRVIIGRELKNEKLLLRPLSSLTKPINWGLQTYEFTSLFEIGDDGGFIYDFGNGNTKLINDLESIAKYNSYHDINYLPYPVVKLMYEYHFDVDGLLESGDAIELKEVTVESKYT